MSAATTPFTESRATVYSLTWYRHRTAADAGVRIRMSGDEVESQLSNPSSFVGDKRELPLICTATFANDHRKNAHVERVHMLGLDLDEPQADPAAYVARIASALGNVELFAYSTFSSTAGAFKLRALIPYDAPATADEHRRSWLLVQRVLARQGVSVDGACKDPGRGFFVWAVPPCGAYFSARIAGEPWPATLAAEIEEKVQTIRASAVASQPPAANVSRGDRVDRARRYLAKCDPAIAGQKGHDQTFLVAQKLVRGFALETADALALFREWNMMCRPPRSEWELRHKIKQAETNGQMTIGALLTRVRR